MEPKFGPIFVLGDRLQNGRFDIVDPLWDPNFFGVGPDFGSTTNFTQPIWEIAEYDLVLLHCAFRGP